MHHKQMTLDSMIQIYEINFRLMLMCTCGGFQTLQSFDSRGYVTPGQILLILIK